MLSGLRGCPDHLRETGVQLLLHRLFRCVAKCANTGLIMISLKCNAKLLQLRPAFSSAELAYFLKDSFELPPCLSSGAEPVAE